MTVNDAVAKRISALLREKSMSQYRLEQESGIQHGSLQCIMNGRNNSVTLSTIKKICDGLEISLQDFFASSVFIDLEQEIK